MTRQYAARPSFRPRSINRRRHRKLGNPVAKERCTPLPARCTSTICASHSPGVAGVGFPALFSSGFIFLEGFGAWPVVDAAGELASGIAAGGGRSDVWCAFGREGVAARGPSCPDGFAVCAKAIPLLKSTAAVVNAATFLFIFTNPCCSGGVQATASHASAIYYSPTANTGRWLIDW
jgi:hypothetical protein